MDAKKIEDMTDDEKQLAIAEFCGWQDFSKHVCEDSHPWYGWHPTIHPKHKHKYETLLPDYLTDLNAMRQAELSLPLEKRNRYITALSIICGNFELGSYSHPWHILNATPLQKVEAFIRII